jgi:C4-dicarboxylate transporter DctM subunit
LQGDVLLRRLVDHLEEWLIAALMAGATIIIFVSVVHRYGTGLSIDLSKWAAARGLTALSAGAKDVFLWFSGWDLSWAQELCIFMFVWMAKFGAAYGVRTGAHVGVDVVLNNLNKPSRYRVVLFALLCGAFFTFVIGSFGARFVAHMFATGQRSSDLEAPMWIVYLAIPLGSYLMCCRFLQVAWSFSRTGELPHTDESHVEGIEPVHEQGLGAGTAPVRIAHATERAR